MAKMKVPKGHGGFSISGAQYKPDKNGVIDDVAEQHLVGAQEHGATLVQEDDDSDNKDKRDYSKMRIGELRGAFTDAFPGMEPGEADKESLVTALSGGWNVFGLGELRGGYKRRFNTDAPSELRKSDLIAALSTTGG